MAQVTLTFQECELENSVLSCQLRTLSVRGALRETHLDRYSPESIRTTKVGSNSFSSCDASALAFSSDGSWPTKTFQV